MAKSKPIKFKLTKTGCHVCVSHAPNSDGYPTKSVNGRTVKIYRYLYQLAYGNLPKEVVLMHTCDNRLCINYAEHLIPGSHAENMADMARKGRATRGERIHSSKLNKRKVATIRNSKMSTRQLADKYGVHESTINRVRQGIYWKHA